MLGFSFLSLAYFLPYYAYSNTILVARHDAADEFADRRYEAVAVERVLPEFVGVVAGEHEAVLDIAVAHDVLQAFLNAEAARIGFFAGGEIVVVFPVLKPAMAEAALAFDLIGMVFLGFFGGDENQCFIRRFEGFGEAQRDPLLGFFFVFRRYVMDALAGADGQLLGEIASIAKAIWRSLRARSSLMQALLTADE